MGNVRKGIIEIEIQPIVVLQIHYCSKAVFRKLQQLRNLVFPEGIVVNVKQFAVNGCAVEIRHDARPVKIGRRCAFGKRNATATTNNNQRHKTRYYTFVLHFFLLSSRLITATTTASAISAAVSIPKTFIA